MIKYFQLSSSLELYFQIGVGAIDNKQIKDFVNLRGTGWYQTIRNKFNSKSFSKRKKMILIKLLYLEIIVKSLIINYQIVAIQLLMMKFLHLLQLRMALKFIEMIVQMQFK